MSQLISKTYSSTSPVMVLMTLSLVTVPYLHHSYRFNYSFHTHTHTHTFSLPNVLCVPFMKRNLISISQFCSLNNTFIEFLPTCFFVKDLHMGEILL